MRTLSLSLALLIGLSTNAAAQNEGQINNWKTLSHDQDEFSLEAPEGFEFARPGLPSNKITARGEFHSESDRFFLFIDSLKEPSQRKQVEAYLRYAGQATPARDKVDHKAVTIEFEDADGFYHRVMSYGTESRIFTLQTVSRTKASENALRFLNNLIVKPIATSDVATSQTDIQNNRDSRLDDSLKSVDTPVAQRGGGIEYGGGYGTGLRSGSGNAQGSGSGVGSGTSAATQPKVTAPLKVLYKQKAQYTDFARFYNIQGTVTLRVTFLATGQIGSITTIKTLPFGLTESAAYAAKRMRFEPEIANGVARNTTRPVSFTFNIY
jgi:TonB family protein